MHNYANKIRMTEARSIKLIVIIEELLLVTQAHVEFPSFTLKVQT